MREIYGYYFESCDEDGTVTEELVNITEDCQTEIEKNLTIEYISEYIAFVLSQTDYSYLDTDGFIREYYNGKDQLFAYLFDVIDNNWKAVLEQIDSKLNSNDLLNETKDALHKIRKVVAQKI